MRLWNRFGLVILVLSLGLNIAFIGAWLASGAWAALRSQTMRSTRDSSNSDIWCPLHRKLGVSMEQWKKIEPELIEFRTNAEKICARVTRARLDLITMLESPVPDRAALSAKQDEILAGQRRMQDLSLAYLLSEKLVLTSEQEAELLAMIREQSKCAATGPFRGFGGPAQSFGQTADPDTTSTGSQ